MTITLSRMEYELLYDSLVGSPRGFAGAERRIGGAVLDKMETWGTQVEGPNGPTYRLTNYETANIDLTEVEAKLAIQLVDSVAWTGRVIRTVEKLLEKLGVNGELPHQ